MNKARKTVKIPGIHKASLSFSTTWTSKQSRLVKTGKRLEKQKDLQIGNI